MEIYYSLRHVDDKPYDFVECIPIILIIKVSVIIGYVINVYFTIYNIQ